MRKAFMFTCLFLLTNLAVAQSGIPYRYEILRVIDGDTVAFKAPFLPAPLKKELHLRIYGIDTPEKGGRAKCQQESFKGTQATEFTKREVAKAKDKQIILIGWDKFGGRVVGDVLLDGKSLKSMLIAANYAREYHGDSKKSWCD